MAATVTWFSKWLEEVHDRAEKSASRLEPWPNYFDLRATEVEALRPVLEKYVRGKTLEIGCGNGFNACLLSKLADEIVATDLFMRDNKTHSQGILDTEKMIEALGIRNCSILSCSGEDLPFRRGSFDTVFSMYTLEHVPDRPKMLRDMAGVLKKGGYAIVVVPNFVERIFYPLVFYRDLIALLFDKLVGSAGQKRRNLSSDEASAQLPGQKSSLS